MDAERGTPPIVAVCGKGGAGKTTLSAALVQLLLAGGRRVLAVDADPAVGLAPALGVTVRRTVDDIRADVAERAGAGGATSRQELLSQLDYQLFEAVSERDNLAFLAIGRPEKSGCYCSVNALLRDIIGGLTREFDFVVVDCEAGVEQVNRRVLERVTHLLQVSDGSARGLRVARTIRQVAAGAVGFERAGLVVNRLRGAEELALLDIPAELECLGWIPEDEEIREADRQGRCLLEVAAPRVRAALRGCAERLGIPLAQVGS